jgi:hypothetical protein
MGLVKREWLDKLNKGFDGKLGVEKRMVVMNGVEKLYNEISNEEIGGWIEEFIERAEKPEFVDATKDLLLRNSGCNLLDWPEELVEMREIYKKCNSVYEFIDEIVRRKIWGFEYKDHIIYTTKPHTCGKSQTSDKEACKSCTDCNPSINHKISRRCHCWMLQTIKEPKSKLFCYCGAGFYKPFFDELWDADTKIEPVKTIIAGDDDCVIAIHIPEKFRK